jgi:hypothetical protein
MRMNLDAVLLHRVLAGAFVVLGVVACSSDDGASSSSGSSSGGGGATDGGTPNGSSSSGENTPPAASSTLTITAKDSNVATTVPASLVTALPPQQVGAVTTFLSVGTVANDWTFGFLIMKGDTKDGEKVDATSATITHYQKVEGETRRWKATGGSVTIEKFGTSIGGGSIVHFDNVAFSPDETGAKSTATGNFTASGTLTTVKR